MNPLQATMARHRELVRACLPGCELSVYSAGGALAWLAASDAAHAPHSLDIASCTRDADDQLWLELNETRGMVWPILDRQETPSHYLLLSMPNSALQGKTRNTASAVLSSLACALSEELALKKELEDLARELALRYEELNLVYHTDDEVRFLDEGRNALRSLVDNCNQYLNVDTTVFAMPEQGVCIDRKGARSGFDTDTVIASVVAHGLDAIGEDRKTRVVNEPTALATLLPGLQGKAILSPVVDGHGQAVGSLAILRDADGPDFVNGDRNLLVVMAGKASKIIQSSYDSLTGLMKQDGFQRILSGALAYARRSQQKHTLLHINVDRMHLINDTVGFQVGDIVLRTVAGILRGHLRDSDQIARLGGDEFGVLLHNCPLSQGEQVAEKLRRAICQDPLAAGESTIEVTACIGIAALDDESDDVIGAQAGAEIACTVAKERGRNRLQVYRHDDDSLYERREQMQWISRVREAINHNRLTLFCQRIVPLDDQARGHHFEILVRMLGENNEILPPNLFLPVAERYQLMPAVDRWVISHTCAQLSDISDVMTERDLVCTINLSGQSLVDEGIAEFIAQQLHEYGIPGDRVCFEITETAAIANLDEAQEFIHEVKRLGCTFALDDFGAGLSSFAYLRTLPVDYLKLDGAFVRNIVEDETAAAMLSAMNHIGQIVGLQTVAEFVEDDAIVAMLKEMGVNFAQGYGIARPCPLSDELALFANQQELVEA